MNLLAKIQAVDYQTSHFFTKFYHHQFLNKLMIFVTGTGDFGMVWLGWILILSFVPTTRFLAQKMLLALLTATLVGQVTIKTIIKRKRPCHQFKDVKMLVAIPSDYSFPSGHTTTSFACATTVFYTYPKVGIFLIVFAFIMGLSRIYLFVHYLSDVIFGMILGVIIGIIIMTI
ncbi:phosphatase PAP2 family protein [uncultured Thomasclavelia sp.]|uniref:phosphatase PAP2 family protein n=1 Tax=uncultured Thomasclavelia sp. TaxID=3025759 RepID=UPI0025E0457A|nr:phosphatase PAP2 family protein [uncultured Thomasclavelia sp.]